MKIGILSTPHFKCPPDNYGGLEVVNHNLFHALINRGHKVILYAPNGSKPIPNGFIFETGEATKAVNVNWQQVEEDMWNKCKHTFNDLDILMGSNWFGYEYKSKAENSDLKCCHVHHGHVNYSWWGRSKPPFNLNFIAISKWMKHCYETGYDGKALVKIPSEYAYNGIDLESYPYKEEKGDRLMFLGRIDPIKAPHAAIDVAEKTKTPIDIVGGTSFVANLQYVKDIEARCAQSIYANFVGEVDHQTKLRLLQDAKALLIPSQFGEPFGLVACEAMAGGTVPIALRDGALSEIIEHGKNGFICNSIDEMVNAISKIDTISLEDCRKRAEKFSKEKMAQHYEELYKRVVSGDTW